MTIVITKRFGGDHKQNQLSIICPINIIKHSSTELGNVIYRKFHYRDILIDAKTISRGINRFIIQMEIDEDSLALLTAMAGNRESFTVFYYQTLPERITGDHDRASVIALLSRLGTDSQTPREYRDLLVVKARDQSDIVAFPKIIRPLIGSTLGGYSLVERFQDIDEEMETLMVLSGISIIDRFDSNHDPRILAALGVTR